MGCLAHEGEKGSCQSPRKGDTCLLSVKAPSQDPSRNVQGKTFWGNVVVLLPGVLAVVPVCVCLSSSPGRDYGAGS